MRCAVRAALGWKQPLVPTQNKRIRATFNQTNTTKVSTTVANSLEQFAGHSNSVRASLIEYITRTAHSEALVVEVRVMMLTTLI